MFGLRRVSLPQSSHAPPAAPHEPGPAAPAHARRAGRLAASAPAWIPVLLLALVALLPRVAELNDFYTTDEAYFWQGRVTRFSAALSMGDWAATNQTGHPGVTTMWLGSLGLRLAGGGWQLTPEPGAGAELLASLRLPLAVANALAVVVGYLLLRRLISPCAALLAGMLWASSPFLIAHSRLLHLDALLTSFVSLSLLSLLIATRQVTPEGLPPARWSRRLALIAAGALAGLALLTKAPALLLFPVSGGVLLAAELRAAGWRQASLRPAVLRAALPFTAWLAAAALVFVALWPAMWVNPWGALGAVAEEIVGNGAQPHNAGNFFMGQPVADPGWGFYLSVLVWRGEILALLGLATLLLLALARRSRRWRRLPPPEAPWPTGNPGETWVVHVLGAFALLFTLALSLLAKKFDRYLLPIWPAVAVLGALGLMPLLGRAAVFAESLTAPARRIFGALAAAGLTAALILPPLIYKPYYLAYYNPLLGGGTTAQAVLLAGWGEGMEQAGAWLSDRPDLRRGPVLSWLPATLAPFVPADVAVYDLDLEQLQSPANYAVVYNSVAERDAQAVAEAYALQTPPLYAVRVRGLTYMTIHQLPRPFERSVGAVFDGIHLRGYTQTLSGTNLVVTPSWDVQLAQGGGVFCFIHVLDAEGRRVAQIDALLDDGMFGAWQAGQQFGSPLPIALPPDLPAGRYQVALGLYRPDGGRLHVAHGEALPEEVAGPDAISLFSFELSGPPAAVAR